MPLQLDAHVLPPEQTDDAIQQAADTVAGGIEEGAAGKRDEPGRVAVELVERQRALALRRAHLHLRDEAAQILVARPAFDERRQSPRWDLGFGIWALGFNR